MNDSKKERHTNSMPSTAVYAEQLRVVGLRVTRPRVGILWAVEANPHADTESIFGVVRAALPEVSRQTVYDVLHALTEVGLLRRFQPSGSVARYETRVGDNHHHFVCRGCGAIADVDCSVGETPCLIPSDECGFLLDETEVIYWGFCQACSGGASSNQARRSWVAGIGSVAAFGTALFDEPDLHGGAVTEVATPTDPAQTRRDRTHDHRPAVSHEEAMPFQSNTHVLQKLTPNPNKEVPLSRMATSSTPRRVGETRSGDRTGST